MISQIRGSGCVCVCVQCLCNNVYMGKTSLSNDCICTFPFQGAHGILISVPYLLCHYTPTIEVYWNGPKSFCVSVRINKKVRFRASSMIPMPNSNFNALTSRIVFSNDPAFALHTLSALETNASAPILLTAARADLVTTF